MTGPTVSIAFGGKKPYHISFSYSTLESIKNSTRKKILSSPSSESEKSNLPHNGTSFFQVGTVPGQTSYSGEVFGIYCQKYFFVLRPMLRQLLRPGASWSALFSMKPIATWSMEWRDKIKDNEEGMKGKTSDDEKHIWNPCTMHCTKCSVC